MRKLNKSLDGQGDPFLGSFICRSKRNSRKNHLQSILFVAAIMMSFMLQSCDEKLEEIDFTTLQVKTIGNEDVFPRQGGTFKIEITTNNRWSITPNSHLSFDKMEGEGNAVVNCQVLENISSYKRTDYISIHAGDDELRNNVIGNQEEGFSFTQQCWCDEIKMKVISLKLEKEKTDDYHIYGHAYYYKYKYYVTFEYEIVTEFDEAVLKDVMSYARADYKINEFSRYYYDAYFLESWADSKSWTNIVKYYTNLPVKKGKNTITWEATQTNYLFTANAFYVDLTWNTQDGITRKDVVSFQGTVTNK